MISSSDVIFRRTFAPACARVHADVAATVREKPQCRARNKKRAGGALLSGFDFGREWWSAGQRSTLLIRGLGGLMDLTRKAIPCPTDRR